MEDEIKGVYPKATVVLIEGKEGIFDVSLDNNLIFSRKKFVGTDIKRFPRPMEIIVLMGKS